MYYGYSGYSGWLELSGWLAWPGRNCPEGTVTIDKDQANERPALSRPFTPIRAFIAISLSLS